MAKLLDFAGLVRVLENVAKKYSKIGHIHSKDEIRDFPEIPTRVSDLINDKGFINTDLDTTYEMTVENKTIKLSGSDGSLNTIQIGDVFSVDGGLSADSPNPVENRVITQALDGLVPNTRMVNGMPLTQDIMITAEQMGAEPLGAADTRITNHNIDQQAHNDLRIELQQLATRLNTLADSDDSTLDQMSELVAYAKANENLIYSITSSKVSVSDIINNLETMISNQPLSAQQGVVLKNMINDVTNEVMKKTQVQIVTWGAED